jgi:hypothetical protein
VPGGLRHGRETDVFPPHLGDKAAGYGGFTGITGRSGRVLAGNGAKQAEKCGRLSSIGHRGLPSSRTSREPHAPGSALDVNRMHPFTARFAPPPRNPAVNRTGLQSKCRSPGRGATAIHSRKRLTVRAKGIGGARRNGSSLSGRVNNNPHAEAWGLLLT